MPETGRQISAYASMPRDTKVICAGVSFPQWQTCNQTDNLSGTLLPRQMLRDEFESEPANSREGLKHFPIGCTIAQLALMTGAAASLGEAIARRLAGASATVAL